MTISPIEAHVRHSTAEVATAQASRYLQQLCKHFGHKRPTRFDRTSGFISVDTGDCRLEAEDGKLTLSLTSCDAEQLERLKDVVARHLLRFAFREETRIDWRE